MKMSHAPLGYPRRDPRRYRFPLPNAVWTYKFRPAAFVILAYICCRATHGGDAFTLEEIADGVHLKPATIQKHLVTLREKGLVTNVCSLAEGFLKTGSGNYFTLPNEVFLLKLSPSAFTVYAYLLLVEDRRTHKCHPSYNTIAAGTGLAKNTVIKSVAELLDAGLIAAEPSYYFDHRGMKWKGNNCYTILPVRGATEICYQRQLRRLEQDAAHRQAQKRLDALARRQSKTVA